MDIEVNPDVSFLDECKFQDADFLLVTEEWLRRAPRTLVCGRSQLMRGVRHCWQCGVQEP